MVRHSKNNTSGAFFTSAEKLKTAKSYGTQTERLGVDSMRKADECCLCLHTVKNPVLCCAGYDSAISGDKTEGKMAHLFCKECILTSILCQRQEIRKAELDLLQESSKAALEAKEMDIQFENKKISAFEASQIIGEDFSSTIQYSTLEPNAKRKTMGRLPKMVTGKVKKSIVCPATRSGEKEHHVSVKELVVVSAGDLFNCRSCLENFSNGVGFSVYKNCGHAVCQKCIKNVNSLGICPSCDVKTEAIKVVCDGTGYASSKEAPEVIVASKYRPAFI